MVTYQQLRSKASVASRAHCWSPALLNCPQSRGQYNRLYITTPRNPNSANSKVGSIVLTTSNNIFANVSGNAHSPLKQAIVLIRGHGFNDTPGVGYTVIRGTMECLPLFNKISSSSIYGVKRGSPFVE